VLLKLHIPQPPLFDFVELFTYYEGYSPEHSVERLLPEGVVEVIIDLTDSTNHIYDNTTLKPKQACRRAWISGMRSKYISIDAGIKQASMFIIRFKRGKAFPFLQIPLSEVDNLVIDYDAIMNGEFTDFREAIIEATSPEAKFARAERFLLHRMRSHLELIPAVDYVVSEIVNNPSTSRISNIVHQTGYSHKHLLSLFRKHVGLSPKEFLRVMKFQQTILRIEQMRQLDWIQVAHDCGYYDQSHFIKDFKEFSGFSPTEYLAMKSPVINYIPIL